MNKKTKKLLSLGLAFSLLAASVPASASEIGSGAGIGTGASTGTGGSIGSGATVTEPTVPPIGSGVTIVSPTAPPIGSGATYSPSGSSYLYQTLYVNTANGGKLNLRMLPSINSACLGQYVFGTEVLALTMNDGWAYVLVNGQYGYMMLQHLSYYKPSLPSYEPEEPSYSTLFISTGNSGRLHLRIAPSQSAQSLGLYSNGTEVTVLSRSGAWYYVCVNGQYGYMMRKFLSTSYTAPVVPSTPTESTLMYVQTGNSGRLHLRRSPSQNAESLGLFSNGTQVTVLSQSGNWVYVSINGQYGYMMRKFLQAYSSSSGTSLYDGCYATVAQAKNSYVNMRAYAVVNSYNVVAQVPSGTTVWVLEAGDTWCRIQYGSLTGYMLTSFLR